MFFCDGCVWLCFVMVMWIVFCDGDVCFCDGDVWLCFVMVICVL